MLLENHSRGQRSLDAVCGSVDHYPAKAAQCRRMGRGLRVVRKAVEEFLDLSRCAVTFDDSLLSSCKPKEKFMHNDAWAGVFADESVHFKHTLA